MSTTPPDSNQNESGGSTTLTRRELREREMQQQAVVAESETPELVKEPELMLDMPTPPKREDNGLPSLFGDDPEEEKVEEQIIAAPYAREAPAAKYLDESPRRIIIPPAPSSYQPQRQYVANNHASGEQWTTKAKLLVIFLSILYTGLMIAFGYTYYDLLSQVMQHAAVSPVNT